jgi:hypothetical protein
MELGAKELVWFKAQSEASRCTHMELYTQGTDNRVVISKYEYLTVMSRTYHANYQSVLGGYCLAHSWF